MDRGAMVTVAPEPPVHRLCFKVIELPHLVCIDQTGKFPVQSRSGKNYLMAWHNYDANDILAEPMPNNKI